jgi:flagellar hook-length control protein FliK
MNATPPIFQAPRISDAAQTNTPASSAQASQPGNRDFAATLRDAGPKPVRRHTSHKQHGSSQNGSHLPASGNQPPPALAPPPTARTEVPAAAQDKDSAGAPPVAQAGNAPADPAPKPATPVAGDSAAPKAVGDAVLAGDVASLMAADAKAGATSASAATAATATAGAPAVPEAPAAVAPAAPVPVSADGASPAGPTMPHAASIRSLQTQGAVTADPKPTVPQGRVTPRAAAASDAPTPATSPALNDQAPSNVSATADTDAAAQAVMAAAVAQTGAPANNASVSTDDTITPDGGISLQGMAAANDAPFAAPTTPHAAAAPSAIAAATAAAVVQAVQGAADAGAADRHSHGNSTDSSLSATTNDGTAGAAQLLTSNPPTDAAPTPTFKIAAGVDTGDFGQGVADRVQLMMDGNLGTAKLQVNPPALGPIEVRIALQAGHAQVWLSSHSAVTRDALESSAPKLREMLGSQGFAQVSVDISQRSFQERSPPSHAYEASPAIGDSPSIVQASTAASRAASGLLDAYA